MLLMEKGSVIVGGVAANSLMCDDVNSQGIYAVMLAV
jgi:hypothetical protein